MIPSASGSSRMLGKTPRLRCEAVGFEPIRHRKVYDAFRRSTSGTTLNGPSSTENSITGIDAAGQPRLIEPSTTRPTEVLARNAAFKYAPGMAASARALCVLTRSLPDVRGELEIGVIDAEHDARGLPRLRDRRYSTQADSVMKMATTEDAHRRAAVFVRTAAEPRREVAWRGKLSKLISSIASVNVDDRCTR